MTANLTKRTVFRIERSSGTYLLSQGSHVPLVRSTTHTYLPFHTHDGLSFSDRRKWFYMYALCLRITLHGVGEKDFMYGLLVQ